MATCILVEPSDEEIVSYGTGVWSECQGCKGRTLIKVPADLRDVSEALGVVIRAHHGCATLPLEPLAAPRVIDARPGANQDPARLTWAYYDRVCEAADHFGTRHNADTAAHLERLRAQVAELRGERVEIVALTGEHPPRRIPAAPWLADAIRERAEADRQVDAIVDVMMGDRPLTPEEFAAGGLPLPGIELGPYGPEVPAGHVTPIAAEPAMVGTPCVDNDEWVR